jgi:hypothetical protein
MTSQADSVQPIQGLKLQQGKRVVVKRFSNRLEKPGHLENFNLLHSKIVATGQKLLAGNSSVVRVTASEVTVAAIRILALVADIEVETTPEGRSV